MFGVFIGEHDNKIDTKGRVSIPAEFRRLLEEGDPEWSSGKNATMAIVVGDHRRNYLEVFTVNDLLSVHQIINRMPRGSRKRVELQRLYANQTTTAKLDETGRIVLTAKLRDKLGLGDLARVVGNGQTFQIWEPATYDAGEIAGLAPDDDFDPNLDPARYLPGTED